MEPNTKKLEWDELWKAMEENPFKWQETTEKMYGEMLEVLPPEDTAWLPGVGLVAFLVGEPSHYVPKRGEMYACFAQDRKEKRFKAQYLSIREFLQLKGGSA